MEVRLAVSGSGHHGVFLFGKTMGSKTVASANTVGPLSKSGELGLQTVARFKHRANDQQAHDAKRNGDGGVIVEVPGANAVHLNQ